MYDVQAPTACVCDARTTPGGTTGAMILAQLCPGGALAPFVLFDDSDVSTEVACFSPPPRLAYQVVVAAERPNGFCALTDGISPPDTYVVSLSDAEACRAHLRVSCGQPEP
jgi:hypothetical protein